MKPIVAFVAVLSLGLAGCSGGETTATKDQEEAFRKGAGPMPPDIAEKMRKSREQGMRKAAEAMQKSGQGNGSGQ